MPKVSVEMLEKKRECVKEEASRYSCTGIFNIEGFGAMGPCHAETGSPVGTGDNNLEVF